LPRPRARPALAPGYERVPGPLRHYREVATGRELSRRQYQQLARGYRYEETKAGKARARARRSYQKSWADFLRKRLENFAHLTTSAIYRELRRLGLLPPHHGAKRKPTRGEAARQQAFQEFIGRDEAATRQYYPTLAESMDENVP
jgi:hypothetical protein